MDFGISVPCLFDPMCFPGEGVSSARQGLCPGLTAARYLALHCFWVNEWLADCLWPEPAVSRPWAQHGGSEQGRDILGSYWEGFSPS